MKSKTGANRRPAKFEQGIDRPFRVGKAKPNARAMERANSNASFKRMAPASKPMSKPAAAAMTAKPVAAARPAIPGKSAQAPGQLKRAAGAQSAKAFAPGQLKKVGPAAPAVVKAQPIKKPISR